MVDLDQDLSNDVLAMPEYLQDFGKLMRSIGSPSLNLDKQPRPVVKSKNIMNTGFFDSIVGRMCNNPMFSDVQFHVCTIGNHGLIFQVPLFDDTVHILYAHKFVLAATSPIFSTMFTGAFKESHIWHEKGSAPTTTTTPLDLAAGGVTVIRENPGTDVAACKVLLRYLYTGVIVTVDFGLTISNESVMVRTQFLFS